MHDIQSSLTQTLVDCPGFGTIVVPLKADPQALACTSEYHDNDHLLMPAQEAMSHDYAMGTASSEECACPAKVGSKN